MPALQSAESPQAQAFVEVAGCRLPVHYGDPEAELRATATAAIMAAPHLGRLLVTGKDREALLHRLTTNEMRGLPPGASRRNVFTNAKGRVVDMVEMLALEDSYLLLTGTGRAETLRAWIDKYTFIEDVKAREVSAEWTVLAVFGHESLSLLQQCLGSGVEALVPGSFLAVSSRGGEVLVHRPESFSPVTCHLLVPAALASALRQELLAWFRLVGFGAHETLRILQGIPAAEREIVEEYNPHEIGLHPLINFEKGCYIGQEVVARLDTYQKVQRQLVGVEIAADAGAVLGAPVRARGQETGKVTSAARAPAGRGTVGLAVVRKQIAAETVEILGREGTVPARVVSLPFASASAPPA